MKLHCLEYLYLLPLSHHRNSQGNIFLKRVLFLFIFLCVLIGFSYFCSNIRRLLLEIWVALFGMSTQPDIQTVIKVEMVTFLQIKILPPWKTWFKIWQMYIRLRPFSSREKSFSSKNSKIAGNFALSPSSLLPLKTSCTAQAPKNVQWENAALGVGAFNF